MSENYETFYWLRKPNILLNIISGLKEIHQKQMVHCDFHTGNILILRKEISDLGNDILISDMGLCGEVGNTDNMDETKIYGVMLYMAPEVLRGNLYTQVADIYSFGMIMYFVATGKQPFANRAHDEFLALDICNEIRPEINEPEAPKCYIDLMKKCFDLNPDNRPNVVEIEGLIRSFYNSCNPILGRRNYFKAAEEYRKLHLISFEKNKLTTHPLAIYTSRILNPFKRQSIHVYLTFKSHYIIII
jgi:serine/threonine protein kinase